MKKHSARHPLLLAFLTGFLAFAILRFTLIKDLSVHYHANFALYVNGVQEKFDNFTYYEEVASCSAEHGDPKHRVHMHDSTPHVIHVHDSGVTWGHFLANLGYGLTNKSLQTDKDVFVDGAGGKLSFILNGEKVDTVANRLINSEDSLLISYGNENQAGLDGRNASITKDAHEFNTKADPASCAGSEKLNFTTRLKRAFDFTR